MTVRMEVNPTIFKAGAAPSQIAVAGHADETHRHPDGNAQQDQREQRDKASHGGGVATDYRSRIIRPPWRSVPAQAFRVEDQAIGAHRDQDDGAYIARPGDREERPGRKVQVVGQHIVGAGRADLVEQHGGVNGDDEQQHERGEDIDGAFPRGPAAAQTRSTVIWEPR